MSRGGGRRRGRAVVACAAALALAASAPPRAPEEPGPSEHALVRTPDERLDRALERATARLAADRDCDADPECGAVAALAATAYGAFDPARRWIERTRAGIGDAAYPAGAARPADARSPDVICSLATPWWLVALYEHWLQTADHDLVRGSWTAVRALHERALESDVDGDGLPIDACPDIDRATVWIEGLRAISDLAGSLGETRFARSAAQTFERAWSALERRYYSREHGLYLRMPAGDADPGSSQRPVGAVPTLALAASLLESDRVERSLNRLASGGPAASALDRGFAGTALYTYHRPHAAYAALRLAARTEDASALALSMFRGLLGLRPDAPRSSLVWAPHLPAEWDSLVVRGYPVGPNRITLSIGRERSIADRGDPAHGHAVLVARFRREGDRPIAVHFAPALPPGSTAVRAEIDGHTVGLERMSGSDDVHASVRFRLAHEAVVRIIYVPGVAVVPIPGPGASGNPGDRLALRVLRYRLDRTTGRLLLLVEAAAGTEQRIRLISPAGAPGAPGRGRIEPDGHVRYVLVLPFDGDPAGLARMEVDFEPPRD